MANSDGKLPSEEQQEQDIEKVPVILKFKDNTYHCKLCRNNTQSRNAFEEHIAAHCLLKPYICIQCNTNFKLRTEMDRHVQKVHENKKVRCGMQGMKKVEVYMQKLLKQGAVKFDGFPRKKLNGNSADSAGEGSKGKSSVNTDNKTGDKRETTQNSTQESDNPSKSADSSENVLHEDDSDESKADNERAIGGSATGSKGEATQDKKMQVSGEIISKMLDQNLDEKNLSKHTDCVGTSAGDIENNSTNQSEMRANVFTCEHGEGTSASTSNTGDAPNITSGDTYNTQSSQIEPSYLSENNAVKTSELICDVEDRISDLNRNDQIRLSCTDNDPLYSTSGREESVSTKKKPAESDPVSDEQINSKHDNSELESSNRLPQLSDSEISVSSNELSVSAAKKSDCVQPTSQEEKVQVEVHDISLMLKKDIIKEKEGTSYVNEMNKTSSDTKTDQQVRSPESSPLADKGQQLSATTDNDAQDEERKQDEANMDLPLRQERQQFTATDDKSLPQCQGVISAALPNRLLLPSAVTDKDPTRDEVGPLMTTVDGVSQEGQIDSSTVETSKDSPQSRENQFNSLTDKESEYDQGRLLTSTTDIETPEDEGRKEILTADEGSLQCHGKEVSSSKDDNCPPEQEEQHTTANDTDSLLAKQHHSISTIDTGCTQSQMILPTEEACDRHPFHGQGGHSHLKVIKITCN